MPPGVTPLVRMGSPPPLQLFALGLECAGQIAQCFAVATLPAVALNLGLSCGAYRSC